ncbi:hypothetical protein NARC_40196 [Candidatus Nitrosocosmicus arcticus]|uniref:Uncharacterized protein n=1 Tax=Candidatus Nitrosocosmicus arcticus TaxID=2035267 RepID=A0A557SXB1_9ARCH|nr:hypothetical protein NARC_40196 [Candidatus Nitrosocosmicus arcticus]
MLPKPILFIEINLFAISISLLLNKILIFTSCFNKMAIRLNPGVISNKYKILSEDIINNNPPDKNFLLFAIRFLGAVHFGLN